MTGYKDKKRSLIGQVSTDEFGANWFLKMKPRLRLAYFMKGMLFGCEQPFLWGERCVTSQKTAAEETIFTRARAWIITRLRHFEFLSISADHLRLLPQAGHQAFSSPEAALLLVSTKNRDLWPSQRSNDWAFAWTRAWFKHFRSISLFIPQNSTVNSATRAISVLSSITLPLQTFFSRVVLLRQQPFSSENLPSERPTTTIAIKTQVFMFRYESVNSTRKFTIVAEIVSLLKKIYKRDAPFRAVFKVKTLAVLFSAYPSEMKHIPRNLNLPPFCRCLFLWKWCNPFPRARARLKHAHSFDRCGPLAMSNTGSPRFTDFPSLCACSESSLTNLIGSGLNLLCLQSHSKPECRWTRPEVAILGAD